MTTQTISETKTVETSLADSKQESLIVSHLHLYIEGVVDLDVYPRENSIRVCLDSTEGEGFEVEIKDCGVYDSKIQGLAIRMVSKENE